jgi:ACR3 family arsenite efflux pump ArsB
MIYIIHCPYCIYYILCAIYTENNIIVLPTNFIKTLYVYILYPCGLAQVSRVGLHNMILASSQNRKVSQRIDKQPHHLY